MKSRSKVSQVKSCNNYYSCISADKIPSKVLQSAYGILPFNPVKKEKRVSFSSNPLHNINLKKIMPNGKYEFILASFSQLIKNDQKDMDCILKLKKIWGDRTDYGDYIANDFLSDDSVRHSYYVTEVIDSKMEPQEKITCIMQTTNPQKPRIKNIFEVNFLQASPYIANVKNPHIKGSGLLSLFGAVKLAKENGFKIVRVVSFNDDFYKKVGFKKVGEISKSASIFELNVKQFDSFLKKVSKKYNVN